MIIHGLVRLESFEAIMKKHNRDKYIENYPPLVVSDGYCLVRTTLITNDYIALQYFYASDNSSARHTTVYITPDESIPGSIYSCSEIECAWCGKNSAEMHVWFFGEVTCNAEECGHVVGLNSLHKDYFIAVFANATIMKRFPRWRWKRSSSTA